MTDVSRLSFKEKAALFAAAAATSTPVPNKAVNARRCSTIDLAKKFENGQLNNASKNHSNDTSADEAIATNFAKNLYLSGHGNTPVQPRVDQQEAESLALIARLQAEEQAALDAIARRRAEDQASLDFIAQLQAEEAAQARRPAY